VSVLAYVAIAFGVWRNEPVSVGSSDRVADQASTSHTWGEDNSEHVQYCIMEVFTVDK
jgi:hypothetical protein